MKKISNIGFLAIALLFTMTGCDKTVPYEIKIPAPQAHFVSSNQYVNYYVRNAATDFFNVQVGTSDVSDVDRTVSFNISSPSGAVNPGDYTVTSPASGNTIVIKAGTAVSSIVLKGNFASYSGGDKDTLVLTLTPPSLAVAKFSDTVKVILQRYCDVNPADFVGAYNTCFDIQAGSPDYGPYTIDIPSGAFTSAGATTGYVMMSNFWDVGGADIRVDLDWTDPANFITSVPAQFLYNDLNYGPAVITGVGTGTFSSCENTFRISYTITVAAGSFGNFITTIAR